MGWLDNKEHDADSRPIVSPPRRHREVRSLGNSYRIDPDLDSHKRLGPPKRSRPGDAVDGHTLYTSVWIQSSPFRFRLTWALSIAMLVIHGAILKLLLPTVLEMNAWMIGGILIPWAACR